MKWVAFAAMLMGGAALLPATPANAAGCIKGAVVGGVAGHVVHHGWLGAAAGCLVGRHMATRNYHRDYNTTYTRNVYR